MNFQNKRTTWLGIVTIAGAWLNVIRVVLEGGDVGEAVNLAILATPLGGAALVGSDGSL